MSWNTADVAAALPVLEDQKEAGAPSAKLSGKTPQEAGWAPKTSYDYELYSKSSKEMADAQATTASSETVADAVGGVRQGDWAGNAAIYVWNDEFGDVGPKFPELERQLFGSEFHVKTGLSFDKIAKVDVIQEGNIRITPVLSFASAGLHPVMLENVRLAGYDVPTPIQQYTMPAIFQGHDIVACAQTGSGKTAAFLIPILSKLMGKAKKLCAPRPNPATFQAGVTPPARAEPLVLIVAPSRELATQIFDEARRFCYRTMFRPCVVYGGGPLAEQIGQLAKGCDILIGTPGRLVDFIGRPHILTLKRLKYMVLDEADEMVGADWDVELKQIMSGGDQEEGNIIYLMFSATFPKMAREMAAQHLRHDHVRIRIGRAGSTHANIKQDIIYCEAHAKRQALFDLLMSAPPARTIIFVNSKRTADEVDDFLFNSDIPCTSIHSDRTQREREDSIRAFRTGKAPVLVTTGVAARGLDIAHVFHVIQYDLPSTQYGGIEEYIHRIGRTGRIGNIGLATSFYNGRDSELGPVLTKTLLETHQPVPDFLAEFIPEGFTADGEGNDVTKLNFEDEFEDAEEGGENTGGGGRWGEESGIVVASGWGEGPAQPTDAVQPVSTAPNGVTSGWGDNSAQPATTIQTVPAAPKGSISGWGETSAPTSYAVQPASVAPAALAAARGNDSWGALPAPVGKPAPQPAQNAWGSSWGAAPVGGSDW